MKSAVVIPPCQSQQNEIHSVQSSMPHSSCTVCGRLNNNFGEQRVFQGPNNGDRETRLVSQEDDEMLPYLTSFHRVIGFIPIVSQFASIFYVIAFKKEMAKIMQVLFAQGFIDFWKFLFIMCQSPPKLIMCRPQKVPPQQSQKSPLATDASPSKSQSSLLQPTIDPSSWMTLLQDRKLCDLCLPATHNSHAYVCQPTPFGTDWVLCQQMTIKEQLEAGIRLLDLRVFSKSCFGHGPALTERIDVVARDVCDFLSKHPHQVVVCLVRANSKTTPEIKNQNVVQLVHDAFQKQLDTRSRIPPCQCTTPNSWEDTATTSTSALATTKATTHTSTKEHEEINIHVPKTLKDANNLKQKTLQDIHNVNNSSNHPLSSLILEPASFWQGSWGQTRSNIVSKVVEECFKWAIPVDNELDATTTSNLSVGTGSTRTALSSTKKHRLMELICTVDAGTTSKMIEVAILHSVKSLNRKLRDEMKRNGNALLKPPVLCHLQGLMLDYPTKHEIQSVITYNYEHVQH